MTVRSLNRPFVPFLLPNEGGRHMMEKRGCTYGK